MRRSWLLPVVVCLVGDLPRTPRETASRLMPTPALAEPAVALRSVKIKLPPPAVPLPAGPHAFAIVQVAVSDDGAAAVSLDSSGRIRLWPALDGTREPVALPGTAPVLLEVDHTPDALAVAALDAGGGLEVMRVNDASMLVGDVRVASDPGFTDVVALDRGFLALRADQVIERIAADGHRIATLAAEPGERVARIIARHGRALVLLRSQHDLHGRWLQLAANALGWGEATPALDIDGRTAVLDRSHQHVAGLQQRTRNAVIVELATGTDTVVRSGVPLGFDVDDRLVTATTDFEIGGLQWWGDDGKQQAHTGELELSLQSSAVGDGAVVAPASQALALVSPTKVEYLGYQADSANGLRVTPVGMSAEIAGRRVILDSALRQARTVTGFDPLPIDDHIVLSIREKSERVASGQWSEWLDPALVPPGSLKHKREPASEIDLVDTAGKTTLQTLSFAMRSPHLAYEPASRVLAVDGGSSITFARFDATLSRFAEPATLQSTSASAITLLDPQLAAGAAVLLVHPSGSGVDVRAIRDADIVPGARLAAPPPIHLPGKLVTVDRAGHVYVRESPDNVVVYAGDREVGRIGDMRGWTLRPSPDGSLVAAFARSRIMLLAAESGWTARWAIGFVGVSDLAWSGNGRLVADARGLATLDLADGHTLDAQCGWRFGLRSSQTELDGFGRATACDGAGGNDRDGHIEVVIPLRIPLPFPRRPLRPQMVNQMVDPL